MDKHAPADKEKLRIVLDTNFLMIPGQFKIDIFEEIRRIVSVPYELCIFDATIEELESIASTNNKDKSAAKIAIELIKQKNLKRLKNSSTKTSSYIDMIILENVSDRDIVCTQDQELKRLLKKEHKNIRLITLKSKRYLGFA